MELEKLAKRIENLKDIEEIKNLHRDYIFAHNCEDWDAMIDCFTETAELLVTVDKAVGKREIASFLKDIVAQADKAKGTHVLIQPVVKIENGKASGDWIMEHFLNEPYASTNVSWGQGRYYCEYAKENGKWKFSLLEFVRPWPIPEAG